VNSVFVRVLSVYIFGSLRSGDGIYTKGRLPSGNDGSQTVHPEGNFANGQIAAARGASARSRVAAGDVLRDFLGRVNSRLTLGCGRLLPDVCRLLQMLVQCHGGGVDCERSFSGMNFIPPDTGTASRTCISMACSQKQGSRLPAE
jgi:hypothetical protein